MNKCIKVFFNLKHREEYVKRYLYLLKRYNSKMKILIINESDQQLDNKIYAEYFKENQPCRTTVEIKSLPTPIAIELKIIANI